MKMSKIAKICKSRAHVEILNESVTLPAGMERWSQEEVEAGFVKLAGTQWIGDGGAFYKMSGLPQIISAAQWFRQYDVPEKKTREYFFQQNQMSPWIDWRDYAPNEETADIYGATIGCNGYVLKGVYATNSPEMLLVNTEYLEPIDDLATAEITIRHSKKCRSYICIRQEMELVAVILPVVFGATVSCINTQTELQFMLETITRQINESRRHREEKKREEKKNAEQSNFDGTTDA